MPFRLDAIDIRLLIELQPRGDRSLSQIAAKLSVYPSTLTRRMSALEGAEIIIGTVVVVDAKKVGRPLSFVISIRMDSTRPEHIEALTAWIRAEPSFQQALMVSDEAGLIITATATDLVTFNALMARFQEDNPVIRKVSSRLVTETIKQTLFGRIQPVVATPSIISVLSKWSRASAGVCQSRVLRGRVFSAWATAYNSSAPCLLRSVPLGMYCRSTPLVFSLLPLCQGLYGSQK